MVKRKRRPPVPKRKWCSKCGKHRVKYHHYLCQKCWEEIHYPEKKEKEAIVEF